MYILLLVRATRHQKDRLTPIILAIFSVQFENKQAGMRSFDCAAVPHIQVSIWASSR